MIIAFLYLTYGSVSGWKQKQALFFCRRTYFYWDFSDTESVSKKKNKTKLKKKKKHLMSSHKVIGVQAVINDGLNSNSRSVNCWITDCWEGKQKIVGFFLFLLSNPSVGNSQADGLLHLWSDPFSWLCNLSTRKEAKK